MANFFAPPTNSNSAFGPQLEPWRPESEFETFGSGLDVSRFTPSGEQFDAQKVSIAFLAERFSLNPDMLRYRSGYEDDITKHAFVDQVFDGIRFANTEAHVTFNRFKKVVSLSASFVTLTTTTISPPTPTITLQTAIKSAEDTLRGTYVPPSSTTPPTTTSADKSSLEYLANKDGPATLVYSVAVRNDSEGTYFQAYVDAHEGRVVAVDNYVAH